MGEKERIEQLRAELHRHNYQYYVLNQPEIGDMEFDQLMHELQDLEVRHPELFDANSPTQRVGSDLNQRISARCSLSPILIIRTKCVSSTKE